MVAALGRRWGWLLALLAWAALPSGPAGARDCEAWNSSTEFRCLSQGEAARLGEPVRVENVGDGVQTLSHQAWFSVCGVVSDQPPTPATAVTLQPGETLTIPSLPHPGAVAGDGKTYCTELFIFACNAGRLACTEDLVAEIDPPAAPPARACVAWDGGERVRCLSERSAARRGGGTVAVTNVSAAKVGFQLAEWHSVCGAPGNLMTHASRWLAPGATVSFVTYPNTAHGNTSLDITNRCTEVYLAACSVDGLERPCAALLQATVTP